MMRLAVATHPRTLFIAIVASFLPTCGLANAQNAAVHSQKVEFGINPLEAGSYSALSLERQISLLVTLRLDDY